MELSKVDKIWVNLMKWGSKMGCHQLPERSFFYKGYQFPVCARCTGVMISSVVAFITFFLFKPQKVICFILCLVMFLDWLIQRINIMESTNFRRIITGLMGGFGFMSLQMYFYEFVINKIAI